MKRKKFVAPETLMGWWDSVLLGALPSIRQLYHFRDGEHIRIIRERDLKRLLKLARKASEGK